VLLRLRRRLHQVAKPPYGSVVTFTSSEELPKIYVGNEGLPVGCVPDGPAECFRVLGRLKFETFLTSAWFEWLCQTPCSHAGYLGVSTLHTFKNQQIFGFIIDRPWTLQLQIRHRRRLLRTMLLSRFYWVSSDTRHHRLEASSRSARLQGLHEVGPSRLLAVMLRRSGCLYTSFDQDHDSVFFSFWRIKPAILPASMLGDYSTSASLTPSCFPRRTDLLGNLFLITSLLDLLFLLFSFLDHHIGHPACHDARILLYECVLDAH
jgi:hypothetical protein